MDLLRNNFNMLGRLFSHVFKMNEQGVVSSDMVALFRPHKDRCNESAIQNELNREFDNYDERAVVVSDLTYVRVNQKWNYVCLFVDLFNREIIDFDASPNKDAQLVYKAISTISGNIEHINLFHIFK